MIQDSTQLPIPLRRYDDAQIEGSVVGLVKNVHANTFGQPGQYMKMGVLALLYTAQVRLLTVDKKRTEIPKPSNFSSSAEVISWGMSQAFRPSC